MVAAVGHRQPADEVREPDVRGPLLLGVLVEVVVELPRLVSDPEVVLLLADEVVEDHEVREQDLVHPADRLEAVEVVLGGLALDVRRLVGQEGAGRVDPLAASLEHGGDGMLGQPVDLEVGVELPQLVGDRGVPLGVAEADRRGDVEGALAAGLAAHPAAGGRRRRDEVAKQVVHLHRIACLREVPRALERDELPARRLGERQTARVRVELVLVAVQDEHRTANTLAELPEVDAGRKVDAGVMVREDFGGRLERPADGVLDLLRRMRLGEALPDEEREEVPIVP